MAKTTFVALLWSFRVGDSVFIVIPNLECSIDVSDTILLTESPNIKELDISWEIHQKVAFLQSEKKIYFA